PPPTPVLWILRGTPHARSKWPTVTTVELLSLCGLPALGVEQFVFVHLIRDENRFIQTGGRHAIEGTSCLRGRFSLFQPGEQERSANRITDQSERRNAVCSTFFFGQFGQQFQYPAATRKPQRQNGPSTQLGLTEAVIHG